MKKIFQNWRTTLVGILTSAPLIAEYLQNNNENSLFTAIALILLGLLSKDAHRTSYNQDFNELITKLDEKNIDKINF